MGPMYQGGCGKRNVVLHWHQHINILCENGINRGIQNGESFGRSEFLGLYRFSCGLQLISDTCECGTYASTSFVIGCVWCYELLDLGYVMRESIFDKGNRLIEECNRIFYRNILSRDTHARSEVLWNGPVREWVKGWPVQVRHIPRGMNAVADKLAVDEASLI
ncbi:hypothetical protein V6N13_142562 [Hibiscus sabdariffa]